MNSVHDECHVSNRHMTCWHNAWWIRVDSGPHMRSARGRRRTWRAARQAAEQVRDGNRVGKTWREERERLKKGERGEERQNRKSNEATLHLILHVSQRQQQQHSTQIQPLHPGIGALLHNERTSAVLDEPCGRGDVVDVSAGPALENLLGLWSGLIGFVTEYYTSSTCIPYAISLKPRSCLQPQVSSTALL